MSAGTKVSLLLLAYLERGLIKEIVLFFFILYDLVQEVILFHNHPDEAQGKCVEPNTFAQSSLENFRNLENIS